MHDPRPDALPCHEQRPALLTVRPGAPEILGDSFEPNRVTGKGRAMMDKNPSDPLRLQLVRLLDWEEAHVGFDKAIDGLPTDQRGALAPGIAYSVWQLVGGRAPAPCATRCARLLPERELRARDEVAGRLLAAGGTGRRARVGQQRGWLKRRIASGSRTWRAMRPSISTRWCRQAQDTRPTCAPYS